ncbi:hypothetical protein [Arthrobacter sp. SD76]|uniref:hypothetical protein n=1 Tax=Arthrobacter sp. SD76 TaxID=3415007 RepID=UPI003C76D744
MRELYDRLDSDYLGFIPDFSATMHRITPGLIQILVDAGLPSRLVPDLQRIWAQQGKPAERLGEFLELARAAGAPEGALVQANAPFTMNGHEAPNSWVELMPRVFHVHAKFYEIGADGQEPSIDYEANLGPLRDAGFSGSISSEWEAHSWTPIADLDTFALIRRQQELIRTIFGMD